MNKRTFLATAAALFAAGSFVIPAHAEAVHCGGTNACKGKGFTEQQSSADCTAKGGKVL